MPSGYKLIVCELSLFDLSTGECNVKGGSGLAVFVRWTCEIFDLIDTKEMCDRHMNMLAYVSA